MNKTNGIRTFLATATCITCINAAPALAVGNYTTPSGENVVSGTVTLDHPGQGRLNINQSSDRAIIHWDNFDTGKKAKTEFFQPNSSSLTVNRVTSSGSDPTQILGTLKANGNIMVLDPNGVLFGNKSVVDVNGIIASTGNVDDSSITGGDTKFVFDDFGETAVDVRGKVNVADAGLAAFVAPTVKNSGEITAKLGRVQLAAGGSATTVDLYGDDLIQIIPGRETELSLVQNFGKIIAEGGNVQISAEIAKNIVDSTTNLSGLIDVSSVTRDGGKIILGGINTEMPSSGKLIADSATKKGGLISITPKGGENLNGTLSANGATGGGEIKILGGEGITLGRKGKMTANSLTGKGGNITIARGEGRTSIIDGDITSSGATGGGIITLANGDDPYTIGKNAEILSEGRDSGKGGQISVSSAEGSHNISGHLISSGKEGGGPIGIATRSGLRILSPAVLESRSTGSGVGGNIFISVGEGDIQYDGKIISTGKQGGGNIFFQPGNINLIMSENSVVSSLAPTGGKGGNIMLNGVTIDSRGLINSSGQQGGGNILFSALDNTDVSGTVKADALQAGNGGNVDLKSLDGAVNFSGKIFSRGGPVSGNGGKVTFSTPNVVQPGATVNVSAPSGTPGTFIH